MILEAAGRYFEKKTSWSMCDHLPQKQTIQLSQKTNASLWPELFKSHYSIETDHQRLLALSELPDEQLANEFDLLRKNYPARYEYNQYLVEGISDKTVASQIEGILFNLK